MSLRKLAMRDIRRAEDARLSVSAAETSALIVQAERAAEQLEAVRDRWPVRMRLARCRHEYSCGNYDQAAREARELLADLEARP